MMKIQRLKTFSAPLSQGFDRSAHLKRLHAEGRYAGTSKIGQWNQSDEKRDRMRNLRITNSLEKSSRGYGSEYHMRVANRILLNNKFQGESGYLYFLRFPMSIKVGFSKNWERRVEKQILGGTVIAIVSGPTSTLADLEFDTFDKFKQHTKLSTDGTRYTEFLDLSVKDDVYKFIKERVRSEKGLTFEIENKLT